MEPYHKLNDTTLIFVAHKVCVKIRWRVIFVLEMVLGDGVETWVHHYIFCGSWNLSKLVLKCRSIV